MRYLSFLLVSLFFVISCGDNEEKFASLDSESRHSSETSEYRQELQSMVEDQEPRVGGKKRNGLNIKKTVGDNSVIKKHKFVTNIHVANIVIEGSPAGESADGSDGTADSGDQNQGDTADSGDHKQEVVADSGDQKQEVVADSGDQNTEKIVVDFGNKEQEEVVADSGDQKQEVVADSGDQKQEVVADSGDQKQEVEADSGDQNTEKIVVDFGNKEQEEVVADSGKQNQEEVADSGKQNQEEVADSGKQEVVADSEVFNEHPVMSGKQLDLLFYMETRDSNCIRNIKKYAYQYGFLEYLDHLSWQVGFSFYTENESKLIPLHNYNGQPFDADRSFWSVTHDFILSRWEYSKERRDLLFRTTLESSYPHHSEDGNTRKVFPNSNGFVFNPLSGLDHFLDSNPEKFLRKDAQTVVIISGDAFPYYNAKEWDRFFKKHKDVDFIAVSYRSANISNFMHILNKAKYNFEYVPACDTMQSTDKLLEAIDEKVH